MTRLLFFPHFFTLLSKRMSFWDSNSWALLTLKNRDTSKNCWHLLFSSVWFYCTDVAYEKFMLFWKRVLLSSFPKCMKWNTACCLGSQVSYNTVKRWASDSLPSHCSLLSLLQILKHPYLVLGYSGAKFSRVTNVIVHKIATLVPGGLNKLLLFIKVISIYHRIKPHVWCISVVLHRALSFAHC